MSQKIIFLNHQTLEVEGSASVSPPYTFSKDSVIYDNGAFIGINKLFMIVDEDFDEQVTKEMIIDFQRSISYQILEVGFKNRQANLMSESPTYDDYMKKEDGLKRAYFQIKKDIGESEEPFNLDLNLELNLN